LKTRRPVSSLYGDTHYLLLEVVGLTNAGEPIGDAYVEMPAQTVWIGRGNAEFLAGLLAPYWRLLPEGK
jgi:hypothetical protein